MTPTPSSSRELALPDAASRGVARFALCLAACVAVVGLPACRGGARTERAGGGTPVTGEPGAASSPAPADASPNRGREVAGEVNVSEQELAPMDAYVRTRRWILADDVEVIASREYFVQRLSFATNVATVTRTEQESPDETVIVLRFAARSQDLDVGTAPRILVGEGITVSARRQLVVRFQRTRDVDVPVRLRVTARGRASTGVASQVDRRSDALSFGASLRRVGGRYAFQTE